MRVKGGYVTKQRRKKWLKLAKGYEAHKHVSYRGAFEQLKKSFSYAFAHRKLKKRDFRKLWIQRINAAARMNDLSYSKLINGLKNAKVEINRKMLSEMAIHEPESFKEIIKIAKTSIKPVKIKKTKKVEKKVGVEAVKSVKKVEATTK